METLIYSKAPLNTAQMCMCVSATANKRKKENKKCSQFCQNGGNISVCCCLWLLLYKMMFLTLSIIGRVCSGLRSPPPSTLLCTWNVYELVIPVGWHLSCYTIPMKLLKTSTLEFKLGLYFQTWNLSSLIRHLTSCHDTYSHQLIVINSRHTCKHSH